MIEDEERAKRKYENLKFSDGRDLQFQYDGRITPNKGKEGEGKTGVTTEWQNRQGQRDIEGTHNWDKTEESQGRGRVETEQRFENRGSTENGKLLNGKETRLRLGLKTRWKLNKEI